MRILFTTFFLLSSAVSVADNFGVRSDMSFRPNAVLNFGAVVTDNLLPVGSPATKIRIINSCFGTNLRSVSNPLSPTATISLKMSVEFESSTDTITVSYPARSSVKPGYVFNPTNFTASNGTGYNKFIQDSIAGMQSYCLANKSVDWCIPFLLDNGIKLGDIGKYGTPYQVGLSSANGTAMSAKGVGAIVEISIPNELFSSSSKVPVKGVSAIQTGAPGGNYMGSNGVLSGSYNVSKSTDRRNIEVYASFPGQSGFCGGYYSPLMLFFSQKRPSFQGVSMFPLHENGAGTYWPSREDPGYFLGLDQNGDGKISNRSELFSNSKKHPNGFESLKSYDLNKDNLIDYRDPVFKKLVLWKDKNSDGVSQKNELSPLSTQKITWISLNYNGNEVRTIANRAEARERSNFAYIDKKGHHKLSEIIDYWFSPVVIPIKFANGR